MKKLIIPFVLFLLPVSSCDVLQNIDIPISSSPAPLSTTEIIQGLKEALKVGTNNSIQFLGKEDGFYGSELFRIPFPDEAKIVEEKLRGLGMDKVVDDFIVTLNRGAEKAVQKAGPIFANAVTSMSFDDARRILSGPDNAATEYFRQKTTAQLIIAFKPDVKNTLDEVNVTRYWSDITTTYNKIPFTNKVDTDLAQYVTEKTVNALFVRIEEEEKKIRRDPGARVTQILQRVFGSDNP